MLPVAKSKTKRVLSLSHCWPFSPPVLFAPVLGLARLQPRSETVVDVLEAETALEAEARLDEDGHNVEERSEAEVHVED